MKSNNAVYLLIVVAATISSGMLILTNNNVEAFSSSSIISTAISSSSSSSSHRQHRVDKNKKSIVLFSTTDDNKYNSNKKNNNNLETRRETFQRIVSEGTTAAVFVAAATATTTTTAITTNASPANAATTDDVAVAEKKQYNLSNEDIMKIISSDMITNQFLVTGNLTRSIYSEDCTFQDEIDIYTMNKWISGTSKLFDPSRSKVLLVDNSIKPMVANDDGSIELRFVEYLCFNIPFVKPIVYLSGTLELKRGSSTTTSKGNGLITSYQEKWDQNIYEVLSKKSKLFSSSITNEELDQELQLFYNDNANLK
ncbi:hypothetical protein FRACYDRAFT_249976 [Fragilariopsis cylindrus CCMP1102]|uniref:Uncharacterized protein n=1 Tax=Fragilariopsis cylindrus CCMP1102 TaxID=635003 RepID=A0A1E7EQF9_9STRA|nr:hypothetical protein FRACYDRAFT_249976 [Fragilariopsis cylindrus CCMP1102]|eukprot:OEU08188.1 hypothetical protein FRACYDRAFT_249976 [Fragilariopsis cylindrus CCMP1102]